MPKYILTVTLNSALDRTISVEKLSAGKDLAANVEWAIAGGKGINVARVLKRLGHKVLATGMLGGNTGRSILAFMKKENIPASFTQISATTRVHTTIHERSTGSITRLLEKGEMVSEKEYQAFKYHYSKLLYHAFLVVFSGSLPPGLKNDSYYELILMAHKFGIPCALDSSGEALKAGLAAGPEIVKPNREELTDDIREQLKKYPPQYCLVTLGEKGSLCSDGTDTLHIKPKAVKGKNHVGCGDTFLAGFISALTRKKDFKSCVDFASFCARANLYAPYTGAI